MQRVFSRQAVRKIRLVGDSIRMGYEPAVMSSLRSRQGVDVAAVPSDLPPSWAEVIPMGDTQGGTSRNILENIDDFILQHELDILHLNCGLHDMAREGSPDNPQPRVSLEGCAPRPASSSGCRNLTRLAASRYASNLRAIVRTVREAKPLAKIVLCTTTCVDLETQVAVEYGIYRSNEDVADYNEAMRGVAESEGVGLHDLHGAAVRAAAEGGLGEDGVHWTEEGAQALGQAVAAHLWGLNCGWGRQ